MPNQQLTKPRVFISHSSKDKDFVRRLVDDLKKQPLDVWFDENELQPGDSIVSGIGNGLKEADYVVAVISEASAKSNWVQQELNTALMQQLSGEGTVVLPIKIDATPLPTLLQDIVYADFRNDYNNAFQRLLAVLLQETSPLRSLSPVSSVNERNNACIQALDSLTGKDLRLRIKDKLSRTKLGTVWFDTFNQRMEDDMLGRDLDVCIIELISRAKADDSMKDLLDNLCREQPSLVNPH